MEGDGVGFGENEGPIEGVGVGEGLGGDVGEGEEARRATVK